MGFGGKKAEQYGPEDYDPKLEVDPAQGYKASKLNICSCSMPHMLSFHFAWMSFFFAFVGWFALAPLAPVLIADLNLSQMDLFTANITSVAATILARFGVGPLCDRFGPKTVQCLLLCWGAVFIALSTGVTNASGLIIIRLLIGIVGSTFVPCQYWSAMLFTKERAGAAQAIAGGWGNLGGGVTQILIVSVYTGINASLDDAGVSWRLTMIVPAGCLLITAICMYLLSVDSPRGDYKTLIESGTMKKVQVTTSAKAGFTDMNAWVLCAQYAGSFGVELTVNNFMAYYFYTKFNLSLQLSGTIAACFGLMNIFARAWGGLASDYVNKFSGMRGRLWVHMGVLFFEGIMLIIFSRINILGAAVPLLILFSLFVQAAEGATFALVPYVNPPATGSVAGIVGAGGNIGAVCWSMIFRFGVPSGLTMSDCFMIVGFCVVALSLLSPLIWLKDYDALCCNPRRQADNSKPMEKETSFGKL